MTTIIVLFNLKSDASKAAYESWAKTTDLRIVRKLKSIDSFEVFKSQGLLGSDAKPPYQYVEVLQVNDMDVFGAETSTDQMGEVAKQFQSFADNPLFMLTENIEKSA